MVETWKTLNFVDIVCSLEVHHQNWLSLPGHFMVHDELLKGFSFCKMLRDVLK